MTTTLDQFRELMERDDPDNPPVLTNELVGSLDRDVRESDGLTIAAVSELVGVTADTLRYYEKANLVQVPRLPSGHRLYDRVAIGRVIFITRLRASDMPIRDIEHYIALADQGEETVPERLELMRAHRRRIEERIADMQWALAIVDYKINSYTTEDSCL